MRLYWYHNGNFGDELGPYLAEKISGTRPDRSSLISTKLGIKKNYASIGSLFQLIGRNTIVWGSGVIGTTRPIHRPKKILAIRGPLSREVLIKKGINCPKIYGDPALLLPKYYRPKSSKKYELGIIPNYIDYRRVKKRVKDPRIRIINVKSPIEKVIDEIFSCNKTIASSLHGLIVSHAYDIPSVWIEFSNNVVGNGFKFRDYLLSVGIKVYTPKDFKKQIPRFEKLVKLFDNYNSKINIDLQPLEKSCPFNNKI